MKKTEFSGDDIGEMLSVIRAAVRRNAPPWLQNSTDDLVQDAAMKILEILNRSEGNRAFSSSYLWKVGYSVVIDEIRRARRRKEMVLEDEKNAQVLSPGPGPEGLARMRIAGQAIRSCLALLSEERRQVLSLRLIGYKIREISSLLEWTFKRVENLVYRGMSELRSCLERKGIQP